MRNSLRQPILGADFLTNYSLLVDTANQRLLQGESFQQNSSNVSTFSSNKLTMGNMMDEVLDVENMPCIFAVAASIPKNQVDKVSVNCFDSSFPTITSPFHSYTELKHSVRHHIHTEGPPVYCRPRRLSPEMLNVVKAEFDKLLEQGIASRSNSNWASPLHLVKKADGSYRPCGDYRKLNSITTRPTFSIPHLFDFVNNLKG